MASKIILGNSRFDDVADLSIFMTVEVAVDIGLALVQESPDQGQNAHNAADDLPHVCRLGIEALADIAKLFADIADRIFKAGDALGEPPMSM